MKRTALRRKTPLKRGKPIRGMNPAKKAEWGREKMWLLAVTRLWQKEQVLRLDACYCCLCDQFHGWDWSTAEHIETRTERPDLIHEPMNFQPAGLDCNGKKHRDMVAGGDLEKRARGDKRPESLRLLIGSYRVLDWDMAGRRPKVKPEVEWRVKAALEATGDWLWA